MNRGDDMARSKLNHKYIINTFPEVPSHLIQEITSNVMPHYIFYKKNKSKAECYCTNCKTRYELDYYSNQVAHNRATVCEKCGKPVLFKSDGMGRTKLEDKEKVSILLPCNYSGIYIRNFTVVQKLEDYETFEPKFKETQRYYISNSGSLMWDAAYQYHNNKEPLYWNIRKSIYTPSIFWNGYNGKDVIQINYQSLKETAYKYTEERSKKLNKYDYTSGDFAIVVPQTASSIIDEGARLNHCVGGYVQRHADGKVIILFLRKTNAIDTPFYTIEINPSNQSIVQCKGFKNKATTQEVEDFLKEWQNFMNNKKQRIRQGVA